MQKKPTRSSKAAKPRRHAAPELRELAEQPVHHPMMHELYRRAEAEVRKQRKGRQSAAEAPKTEADTRRLLHELQVHQVELEMQNAALQESRDRAESLVEKYTDLYDFSPVGYFTVAPDGAVLQANLTGTGLVGIERARLIGQLFGVLMVPEQRPALGAFLRQAFSDQARHSGDFVMLKRGGPPICVSIEAKASADGRACRLAVMDISVRKQVEDSLRISERRYRRLFEAAHDGVLILDPVTRKITDANPFMTQMLGYSHDQLVGKELFEIGLLKDEAASQEMVRRLKRQHEVRYEDLPLESKGGRHQEVEVVANLYRENGHAVIQCNIRDITVRKTTEHELAEKARLLDLSHDAIIVRDMEGRIRYWNDGAKELYGWSRKQAFGKISNVLLRTEYPVPLEVMTEELFRTDRWIGELVHTARDGRRITVFARKTLDRDARGKPAAVLENITDISTRKEAEEALRRSEALFSALVAQVPVGVYVVDSKFRLQQLNPTAMAIFKKVHPLIGRDFSEVIHLIWPRRVAAQIVARFRHTLKTGEPYQSPEFAERRRDTGAKEHYEWQIQRVTLPAGENGVVCFVSNITKRIQAEETQRRVEVLATSNQKLEGEIVQRRVVEEALRKSDQHQRQLLEQSGRHQEQLRRLSRQLLTAQEDERREISRELHDVIAQTLTGINVRLAALKKGAALDTGDLDRSIGKTQRLVEKSVDIVHRFARDLRPTMLDDLGLIPALHSFMKSFTTRTGIRAHLTVFAAVEKLEADKRTVLYRVAQEALTNVGRHSKAAHVDVTIQKRPHGVSMGIKDDGKSFNVERALAGNGSTRLGLLGMRERVEMVGGAFGIQSAPGKGTTIKVEIPFKTKRTTAPKKSSRSKMPSP